MGDLTLEQYRDEMRRHLGGRNDQSDEVLTRAINIAQVQLARTEDFEELRVLATPAIVFNDDPNDRFLAKSSIVANRTIREIFSFVVSDDDSLSGKLTQRPPRQMDRFIGDPNNLFTRRIPEIYSIWDTNLELFPLPDKAYSTLMRVTVWPVTLSVEGDISIFTHKDDIIIHLSVSWIYHSLGEYDRAKMFFGFANANTASAISQDVTTPDKEIKPPWERFRGSPTGEYWRDPLVRRSP